MLRATGHARMVTKNHMDIGRASPVKRGPVGYQPTSTTQGLPNVVAHFYIL